MLPIQLFLIELQPLYQVIEDHGMEKGMLKPLWFFVENLHFYVRSVSGRPGQAVDR